MTNFQPPLCFLITVIQTTTKRSSNGMNWVPDKTQDWNTKCIYLFIPVFPFRPHLSQTKQVCSLKPNVYGTLIQMIKLPIILAWTNTVENRIAQHLRSVHLLRHLPMALFGGFGASSLQSSTAQYCSWGGRCLHNTSTCCKAACNPRCTYVALCIFFFLFVGFCL